jgi:hypothetical protein
MDRLQRNLAKQKRDLAATATPVAYCRRLELVLHLLLHVPSAVIVLGEVDQYVPYDNYGLCLQG